jgi:hypothetical protein
MIVKRKSCALCTGQSLMRMEPAVAAEGEDEFLDSSGTATSVLAHNSVLLPHLTAHSTADQENVIADLRRQNARSARFYSVRHYPPTCQHVSKVICSLCLACARSLTAFLCSTFCCNISCFLHSPRLFAVMSSCSSIRICLAVPWPCFCSAARFAGKHYVILKAMTSNASTALTWLTPRNLSCACRNILRNASCRAIACRIPIASSFFLFA